MQQEFITVTFNRTKIAIRCADILYVIMSDDHCTIHMFDGSVYRCRMTLKALKKQLNEGFMEVKRGCMIAVSAISNIGDKILLSNGEEICYTKRKKKALREELQIMEKHSRFTPFFVFALPSKVSCFIYIPPSYLLSFLPKFRGTYQFCLLFSAFHYLLQ